MEDTPVPQGTVNNIYRCAHCACIFCTEGDLKRHLELFGGIKAAHFGMFQRTHGRLEHAGFNGSE